MIFYPRAARANPELESVFGKVYLRQFGTQDRRSIEYRVAPAMAA